MRHPDPSPAPAPGYRAPLPRRRAHPYPGAPLRALLAALLAATFLAALPLARARAENWALLIGIDQYADRTHINALGAAAADARALKAALVESVGFPDANVRLLVSDGDNKPTRSNILTALAGLARDAAPGDTVFVLYSGHGIEIAGVPYLLPYDATAADDDTLAESALKVATFRLKLTQVKARALVLAFDMCRTDPRKGGKDATAAPDNKLSGGMARGLDFKHGAQTGTGDAPSAGSPVAVTLYSCSPDERSYEWGEMGRGYFSYYLEQGLRGKASDARGRVTLLSLSNYVSRETRAAVQRGERKTQTPYPSLDGVGADDFVLSKGVAGGSVAPAPEPVTEVANASVMDTKARLTVSVNAPGAAVAIDGVSVAGGSYAANLLDAKEKDVEVRVTADGYEGQLVSVKLLRGKTVTLPVVLAALPPKPVAPVAAAVVDSVSSGRFTPPLTLARYRAQMVRIPAGKFTMGSDTGRADEKPAHKVMLSAYRIGRTAVTVGMYEEFCQATKRAMPEEPDFNKGWGKKDHPIVNVSWDDAMAYCAWAHLKLPSEAQWEKAARGSDGREFPWGNEFDTKKLWCSTSFGDAGGTRVVGDFPAGASPYGCLDMAGNVFQWCADTYDEGFYGSRRATETDPVNESPGDNRVLRGGSWYIVGAVNFRCALRDRDAPSVRNDNYGFRAVLPGLP